MKNAVHINLRDSMPVCGDYTKRERDTSLIDFQTNFQVRYMKNLRGKLSPYSCDERLCPVMKERLHKHQLEHHPKSRKGSKPLDHGMSVLKFDEDLTVTLITNPNLEHGVEKPAEIQTEPFKPTQNVVTESKSLETLNSNDGSTQTGHIPLRTSETIEVLTPNKKFYREYVRNEIQDWVRNIPMYQNPNAKMTKENVTNELLEDIIKLANDIKKTEYDKKLKFAIDECLDKLPLLIPGDKHDQDQFKEDLLENLFNSIIELNKKLLEHNGSTDSKVSGSKSTDSIDVEVVEWLNGIEFNDTPTVDKEDVSALLKERLTPILDVPMNTTNYKLKMKGEIVGVLNDLPIRLKGTGNKFIYLNRFAEDLANRLLSVQCSRRRHSYQYSVQIDQQRSYDVLDSRQCDSISLRHTINDKLKHCLDMFDIKNDNITDNITNLLIDNINSLQSIKETNIENEITELLYGTCDFTESQSSSITEYILKRVKDVLDRQPATKTLINQQLSGIISVYTSEEAKILTAAPKRKKKEISKLAPDEEQYTKKVTDLVSTWVDTLPESKRILDDKEYKEVVIYDLATNLTDTIKLPQITKNTKQEEEHIQFIINIWIMKFGIFENADDAKPYIKELYGRLKKIPVPQVNEPASGTRALSKYMEFKDKGHPEIRYVPEVVDLIEDQISLWMNEQSSEIYTKIDQKTRKKMIHELAEKLQTELKKQNPEKEIKTTVSKFLTNVMKSKNDLNELSESLCERIRKLPDEKNLDTQRKTQQHFRNFVTDMCCPSDEQLEVGDDNDKTVKEIVSKYLDHIYDVEDPLTRGVCEHFLRFNILKNDLANPQKMSNRMNQKPEEDITRHFTYICIVSDWLKRLPVDSTFNTPGNQRRIRFVEELASLLDSFDKARERNPDWNYENEFVASVEGFIVKLPLLENQEQNIPYMVNQLQKIIYNTPIGDDSIIHEGNLAKFIEEYALDMAGSIADDELKLEVWMTRLLKEVANIAREDPKALTKMNLQNKLDNMSTPDECVKMFELQLLYGKEISEWLRNIPLLPISNETDEQNRIEMISALAEKLVERKYKKDENFNNPEIDKHIVSYIETWILNLPLNTRREIVVPILIQQLMTRIDKIGQKEEITEARRRSSTQDTKKRDSIKKVATKKDSIKKSPINKKKVDSKSKQELSKLNPGQMVVDAVENWIKNLPIEEDEKRAKYIKGEYAKRLFKKIGELNTDPQIFGDDGLYRDILNEEIDSQLEIMPSKNKLEQDKIKSDFINAILEARKIMKQKSAGDDYVHRLINTLDASISNPVDNKYVYDPGFEIYKNKLANLFILSNFDHCNDDFKLPYEKKIRDEVDKYFTHAAKRNAIPLTKDQINNELFSALFKVPMPNEESIIREVENVKTKLIIDGWYDELPLEEPYCDLTELLERDKILSTLAKRIHELEQEDASTETILKEIKKWITKFPFKVNFRCKLDFYSNKLLNKLNETKEERKCTIKDTKGVKGKGKKDKAENNHVSPELTPDSFSDYSKTSNVSPCCRLADFEERNPTDLILEMIEVWFDKLPIMATAEVKRNLKTDAVTRMVIKISELNADPNIFYDEITYYTLVNQALDEILSDLPLSCDFPSTSDYKKGEFMSVLQNIKPIIHNEKARHEYIKELKNAANSILQPPIDENEDKSAINPYNQFRDELVEEFVQYYYNKEDEKGSQFYKNKVYDTVVKYIEEMSNKNEDIDPLILRNQLICELEKIPIPNEAALKRDVEEIRMKEQVVKFLDENSMTPKNKLQEQIKTNLARKLFEIERAGHTCDNDRKMKAELVKSTRKLGKELSNDKIDEFMNSLKETEPYRKSASPRNNEHHVHQMIKQTHPMGETSAQKQYRSNQGMPYNQFVQNIRPFGPQPPLHTSEFSIIHEPGYESGCAHVTNQSLINIDHLAGEAERWKANVLEENTKRIAEVNKYVTEALRQERMQQFSTSLPCQNLQQNPALSHSLHFNQNIPLTGEPFERPLVQTAIPDHAFPAQPCQPTCGHISNQIQQSEPAPRPLTYGAVNLSCRPCGQPCPHRISPDQVDPCSRGRIPWGQTIQDNQNFNNDYTNQPINNVSSNLQSNQNTVLPTSAIGVPSTNVITENNANYVQGLENNIGLNNAPCAPPLQCQSQGQYNQFVHDNQLRRVPQCCQNPPSNMAPTASVQAPGPSGRSANGIVTNMPVIHEHAGQPISSIQNTDIGTITPLSSQITSNEIPTASEPMTKSESRRQPPRKRIKLTAATETADENQNADRLLCKCGRIKPRKRRPCDDDFEMCFGRLPRCFYY